jgi:DNA repair protein RadA/Sms
MGRCPTCREWNTLQEFKVDRGEQKSVTNRPTFSSSRPQSWLDGTNGGNDNYVNQPIRVTDVYKQIKRDDNGNTATPSPRRLQVPADQELNNVLGGGIMSGSLTLLGGDPGVGKSTLLLQTAGSIAALSQPSRGIGMGMGDEDPSRTLGPVWYVSGEENAEQIAFRAARLGIEEKELWLLTETHVDTLAEQVVASYQQPLKTTDEGEVISGQVPKPPALIVIDSIQTMVCESGGASAAGGVTQVRDLLIKIFVHAPVNAFTYNTVSFENRFASALHCFSGSQNPQVSQSFSSAT